DRIMVDTAAAPAASPAIAWFAQDADAVVRALATDADDGLSSAEAASRLAAHGPNAIPAPPAPSLWQIALKQVVNPMTIMLIAVTVISFFIGQASIGVVVGLLVVLNVVLGTRQELKAKASVDALSDLEIPRARVMRDGALVEIPSV